MNFDSIMGWCTLGAAIGVAVGTLAGASIGIHQEAAGKSREEIIGDAAREAETMEDMEL